MPDIRIIADKRKKIKSIFLPTALLYCIFTSSLVNVYCSMAITVAYNFSPSTSIVLLNTLTDTFTSPAASSMVITSPGSAPL